jgi:hypothetical protein
VGKGKTVLKGGAIRYGGREYARRPLATEYDKFLRREADIYDILGRHDCITRSYGLGWNDKGSSACAVRLAHVPGESLRKFIIDQSSPSLAARLRMAVEFTVGVAQLHSRDVRWLDLSTRNALLFDGLRVKLCDFAGAMAPGIYDDRSINCESRYTPPKSEKDWGPEGVATARVFRPRYRHL